MPKVACRVCGREGADISSTLRVCASCIREKPDEAMPYILEAHAKVRGRYGLPPQPPKAEDGLACTLCSNECRMGDGDMGFCGLRWNEGGKLIQLTSPKIAVAYTYRDPHPTNCCAAWFCPAGTGAGYPRYAVKPGVESGYYNLAVFFYGCNFNCLFCQNSSHKYTSEGKRITLEDFVATVERDKRITCICYFGGSPEPHLPFALEASRQALEACGSRVMRVCWEWNGCGNPSLVDKAAELSYVSGGNVKFDLKAYTPALSLALSGVPNRRAYENFEMIYRKYYEDRKTLPVLTATTLLVPFYVDAKEVAGIAEFIASLNPEIPYSLLVFHPDYYMRDLPITPRKQVEECYNAARKHLKNIHIGNIHLLAWAP